MVKIFPTSFSFVEQQKILSSIGEPLAITCWDGCVFVAEEDCLLEVGTVPDRGSRPAPALQPQGGLHSELERKNATSQGFSRVYFKWRGATVDKPARISLLWSFSSNSALLPGNHLAVEM